MVFYILFCLLQVPVIVKGCVMDRSITFEVAPNIALVKYLGKRDSVLNLPLNSSLSVTLSSVNGMSQVITIE